MFGTALNKVLSFKVLLAVFLSLSCQMMYHPGKIQALFPNLNLALRTFSSRAWQPNITKSVDKFDIYFYTKYV
jgi:hypothetical protein